MHTYEREQIARMQRELYEVRREIFELKLWPLRVIEFGFYAIGFGGMIAAFLLP